MHLVAIKTSAKSEASNDDNGKFTKPIYTVWDSNKPSPSSSCNQQQQLLSESDNFVDNIFERRLILHRPVPPYPFHFIGDNAEVFDKHNGQSKDCIHNNIFLPIAQSCYAACGFEASNNNCSLPPTAPPISFKKIATLEDVTFWRATPPKNYVALGDVALRLTEENKELLLNDEINSVDLHFLHQYNQPTEISSTSLIKESEKQNNDNYSENVDITKSTSGTEQENQSETSNSSVDDTKSETGTENSIIDNSSDLEKSTATNDTFNNSDEKGGDVKRSDIVEERNSKIIEGVEDIDAKEEQINVDQPKECNADNNKKLLDQKTEIETDDILAIVQQACEQDEANTTITNTATNPTKQATINGDNQSEDDTKNSSPSLVDDASNVDNKLEIDNPTEATTTTTSPEKLLTFPTAQPSGKSLYNPCLYQTTSDNQGLGGIGQYVWPPLTSYCCVHKSLVEEGSKDAQWAKLILHDTANTKVLLSNIQPESNSAINTDCYWIDVKVTGSAFKDEPVYCLKADAIKYISIDDFSNKATNKQTEDNKSTHTLKLKKSDWVAQLQPSIQHLPIKLFLFPGAHDAGTYNLDKSTLVGPDAPSVLHRSLTKRLALATTQAFAKTQRLNIKQQLEAGARYIDLRVGQIKKELYIVHSLAGDTLTTIIKHVNEFATAHPKEIFILDFNAFYAVNEDQHDRLVALMKNTFGNKIVPHSHKNNAKLTNLNNGLTTFKTLWDNNQQIIIVYKKSSVNKKYPFLWPRGAIRSHWLNARLLPQLKEGIVEMLYEKQQQKYKDRLIVTQAMLTPNAGTVLKAGFTRVANVWKNLEHMADSASPAVVRWLEHEWAYSNQNIIMIDFFDKTDFINAVLRVNCETSWRYYLYCCSSKCESN